MYTYSIISAVYNVEPYLQDFFKSIVKQTLDFKTSIQIILIDDGSTDNSAQIIQEWQQKYPNNIIYIYQENKGQASARNLGLQYVQSGWVTFIDPDDFVNKNYFKIVDNFQKKHINDDIVMLSCNLIHYFEKFKLYIDNHPLKYKFQQKNYLCPIKTLHKNIQLSASSTFFKTDIIRQNKIVFDIKIRPTFEDGHFINLYLLHTRDSSVAFLKNAKYFYRKRKSMNSSIDNSWKDHRRYDNMLRYGYLDLLEKYNQKVGKIPFFIQRTVLYDLLWYYRNLMETPILQQILTVEDKKNFMILTKKIFNLIEIETILDFELAGIKFYHKVALLAWYKHTSPPYQILFLEKKNNTSYTFCYYAYEESSCIIKTDHTPHTIYPSYITKTIYFLNKKFIIEHKFTIDLPSNAKTLKVWIDDIPAYFENSNKNTTVILVKNLRIQKRKQIFKLIKKTARNIILGKNKQ